MNNMQKFWCKLEASSIGTADHDKFKELFMQPRVTCKLVSIGLDSLRINSLAAWDFVKHVNSFYHSYICTYFH